MDTPEILLWWADGHAAQAYSEDRLSAGDAARARTARGPKAQADWRASRALLQDVRTALAEGATTSLSHSAGHALCASGPAGLPLGADLERIRPRDVPRLARWVCAPQEQAALARLDGAARLERFYLLWTLKEAFVKAARLDFPADMAAVGLAGDPDADWAGWRLRAPPGAWRAAAYRLGGDWVASAVWRAAAGTPARPAWRAATNCVLPPVAILGEWEVSAG